jgi:hypothetical protein
MTSNIWDTASAVWCQNLRMKKALVLVCKTWYAVALPHLYDEVILRRIGQLVTLSHTLTTSNSSIRDLVRGIYISLPCIMEHVQSPEDTFGATITLVLNHTPNLRKISFKPAIPGPLEFEPINDIMGNLGSSLTTLCYTIFHPGHNYTDLRLLLDSCQNLIRLELSTTDFTNTSLNPRPLEIDYFATSTILRDLTLDSLEYLRLDFHDENQIIRAIADTWSLKSLKRLVLVGVPASRVFWSQNHLEAPLHPICHLIRSHNSSLEYLHFQLVGIERQSETIQMQILDVISELPALKHLVIALCSSQLATPFPIRSQTLEWLDMLLHDESGPYEHIKRRIFPDKLPSLRGIRYLNCGPPNALSLLPAIEGRMVDLPLRRPPQMHYFVREGTKEVPIEPFDISGLPLERGVWFSDSEDDNSYSPSDADDSDEDTSEYSSSASEALEEESWNGHTNLY